MVEHAELCLTRHSEAGLVLFLTLAPVSYAPCGRWRAFPRQPARRGSPRKSGALQQDPVVIRALPTAFAAFPEVRQQEAWTRALLPRPSDPFLSLLLSLDLGTLGASPFPSGWDSILGRPQALQGQVRH